MSMLVMVLAAGMAMDIGPTTVSTEIEQELDLRGKWEGVIQHSIGMVCPAMLNNGILREYHGKCSWDFDFKFSDVGERKIDLIIGGSVKRGIYKLEGNRLIICFCRVDRPTEFQAGNGRSLLILRRAKHQ